MITSLWHSILLGIVQGLTEFLPISSSGHMILASHLFNIPENFTNDVLLNFGTIIVMFIFSLRENLDSIKKFFSKKSVAPPYLVKLALGIVPTAIIGLVFGDYIKDNLHSKGIVALMLIVIGAMMLLVKTDEKIRSEGTVLDVISFKSAALIGLAQCLSLVSGTSRSGITILTALYLGYGLKRATSFSFLIGTPIILAASLKVLVSSEGRDFLSNNMGNFLMGNLFSFLAGTIAIFSLVKLLKKYGLKPFGYYRIALGALVILLSLI